MTAVERTRQPARTHHGFTLALNYLPVDRSSFVGRRKAASQATPSFAVLCSAGWFIKSAAAARWQAHAVSSSAGRGALRSPGGARLKDLVVHHQWQLVFSRLPGGIDFSAGARLYALLIFRLGGTREPMVYLGAARWVIDRPAGDRRNGAGKEAHTTKKKTRPIIGWAPGLPAMPHLGGGCARNRIDIAHLASVAAP